jgi:phosphatidylserine decarboxylase
VIRYYHRTRQRVETEKVYGEAWLHWAYRTPPGKWLTRHVLSKQWVSRIFGVFEDSPLSRSKIDEFIEKYEVDMEEFEKSDYSNFNQFFIRKFKPGKRPFGSDPGVFCAGAEARYLVFESLKPRQTFPVKGIEIDLGVLLQDAEIAKEFEEGALILARLCPVDYHRFHFPFEGELVRHYRISGEYHSVNPAAFEAEPKVFLKNERQVAILQNPVFGKVAMIEVGALGVGKIVQSAYSSLDAMPVKFARGAEKGYFLFGGSTVIWLVQKGKLKLSRDLVENSARNLETWVPLGQALGERPDA